CSPMPTFSSPVRYSYSARTSASTCRPRVEMSSTSTSAASLKVQIAACVAVIASSTDKPSLNSTSSSASMSSTGTTGYECCNAQRMRSAFSVNGASGIGYWSQGTSVIGASGLMLTLISTQ